MVRYKNHTKYLHINDEFGKSNWSEGEEKVTVAGHGKFIHRPFLT